MANWTTIRDIINGNLDNGNISASAAIDPSKIDFGDTGAASTLGYAEVTANLTALDSAGEDLTGLAVTVTVPAGGRKIKITGYGYMQNTVAVGPSFLAIHESTTQLNSAQIYLSTTTNNFICVAQWVGTPSAGAHTYKLKGGTHNSLGDLSASSTTPAFILVELI